MKDSPIAEPANETVIRVNSLAASIIASVVALLIGGAFYSASATRDLARSTNQLARTNAANLIVYRDEINSLKNRVNKLEVRVAVLEDAISKARKEGTSYHPRGPRPEPYPALYNPDSIAANSRDASFTSLVISG